MSKNIFLVQLLKLGGRKSIPNQKWRKDVKFSPNYCLGTIKLWVAVQKPLVFTHRAWNDTFAPQIAILKSFFSKSKFSVKIHILLHRGARSPEKLSFEKYRTRFIQSSSDMRLFFSCNWWVAQGWKIYSVAGWNCCKIRLFFNHFT